MPSKNNGNLSRLEPQSIPLLALPFVPFVEPKRLPRLAAIYFVLNTQGTVLYVGQSNNVCARWTAHHRKETLTALHATRIAWLTLDDPALLEEIERACIVYFDPPCNETLQKVPRKKPGPNRKNDTRVNMHVFIDADDYAWLIDHGDGLSTTVRRAIKEYRRREQQTA